MSPATAHVRPFTLERDTGPGLVVVLSAPSGAGKTTVGNALLRRRPTLARCTTATTRAPRRGERDGVDYEFLTTPAFKQLRARGGLLESAEVHGHWYGVPKRAVRKHRRAGLDTLLIIDVQGGVYVKDVMPGAVLIFLLPPDAKQLERRLRARGTDDGRTIARRLRDATKELRAAKQYDYAVVNEDVKSAVATMDAILTAEHARARRTKVRWPRA